MSSFKIHGGSPLHGELTPQGAKNEALQVISATLLTSEPVTIHNIPNIRDVNKLIELIQDLGVKIEKQKNHLFAMKKSHHYELRRISSIHCR